MEVKSSYKRKFSLGNNDIINWNEAIYQLMTQKEQDGTYPVLNKSEIQSLIDSGDLIISRKYITDFTKVKITEYKVK